MILRQSKSEAAIDITVPEPIKAYVDKQIAKSGYKDASDFFVSLVEGHQYRQFCSELKAMLLEAIDGPFEEWTAKTVEDIRREGTAIINRRKGS